MKYRKLGDSDLEVSEISLGSWLTYGVGVEADKARACLEEAFAQDINFIDTANVYGVGAAETFLGEALQGRARDSYVLATKVFFPMSDTDRGLSRAQIEKQLDNSLKRLRTDFVDLYQCHRYDWDTPLEETMEALTRAVDTGKVRYIGFSEWPAERIQAALDMAGVAKFVSSQPQYSLLWPEPEKEVTVAPESFRPSARATRPAWPPTGLTCPECHGPLWEDSTNGVVQFRCRVGHAYTEEVLLDAKGGEVEAAMWSAVEALEEHAELIRKVAARLDEAGSAHVAGVLRKRAERSDERADVLRAVLAAASQPEPEPEAA